MRNPELEKLLISKGRNTVDVWEDILMNEGSVQHLNFLSDHEKDVFRTFIEISQLEIVKQAANRQKYIDQGQSLNLMVHPKTPTCDVDELMQTAHQMGIKTLYYQLGQNAAQAAYKDLLDCQLCAG